jgi:hypothetical protein
MFTHYNINIGFCPALSGVAQNRFLLINLLYIVQKIKTQNKNRTHYISILKLNR